MAERVVVRNAADPEQVKKGKETERRHAQRKIENLGVVLSTYEGREDRWDLLADCKVYGSVFDTHGSRMSYMAGQQDLGHDLLTQILEHYPAQYLLMQRENMERAGRIVEPEATTENG